MLWLYAEDRGDLQYMLVWCGMSDMWYPLHNCCCTSEV